MNHREYLNPQRHKPEICWTCFLRSYAPDSEPVAILAGSRMTIIGPDVVPKCTQAPSAPPSNGVSKKQIDSLTSRATPRNESCLNVFHTLSENQSFPPPHSIPQDGRHSSTGSKPIALVLYHATRRKMETVTISLERSGCLWLYGVLSGYPYVIV
jgi:hypothetical protein